MAKYNHLTGKFSTKVNYEDYITELLYDGKAIYKSCEIFIRIQNEDYAFISDDGQDVIVSKDGEVYRDEMTKFHDMIIENFIDGIKKEFDPSSFEKEQKVTSEYWRILEILRTE